MALKKSELYSSLWQSCDALRGGMDASQYKDYVLVFLFIKYVSDKYAGKPYQPLTIPRGASFADMVALKGKNDIGDQINKKIIAPLVAVNKQLSLSDFPDFNDATKLGSGKEMVDRLTDLVAIFESKALDFSKNRADGDDILGDAYEYLMQHFATESGKSKGQFYTPAEVSRIIAQVLGVGAAQTSHETTVYDPTCGSGSLLLKVADAAHSKLTLYGQEKDSATSGLARMNMILHDNPTAEIKQGNTLADPKFREGKANNESIKVFDYVVANPPFSDKRWSTGIDPLHDPWKRFEAFGVPPAKQGDYAYLLHIVRSLKSTGRGACVLPHGVLFRGNTEADIRRALVRKGYIEAIIGLPANLFYGTGIPACLVVIDKSRAAERVAAGTGIFMIDAAQGFMKDGPKNRLRERDIHRIVDAFQRRQPVLRYARQVDLEEIEENEYNLNLQRYIDSRITEDRQDIEGHLRGGIPEADVTAPDSLVSRYWAVCPQLERALFTAGRPGYLELAVDKATIKPTIHCHPEFAGFISRMNAHFTAWREVQAKALKAVRPRTPKAQPKRVIAELSESLLAHYLGQPLIDCYSVYQHLMDYWAQTMQDDAYLIAAEGWQAQTYRVIGTDKKGKQKDKGWACDLVPKALIVARYFAKEQAALDARHAELEGISAKLTELEEEHGGEDAAFAGFDKINVAAVKDRLREIEEEVKAEIKAAKAGKGLPAVTDEQQEPVADELRVLLEWLKLAAEESALKKRVKEADTALDAAAYARYPKLTAAEVQALVVDDKWLAALDAAVHSEMDWLSRQLTSRVKELAERYEAPVPQINERVSELEARVTRHLEKMGFAWT
ncbi:type I restriction-modification system subunit M [Variovorax sp. J22R115]|uniref:type I restriction-modification system subunit M n=1 Tax=Variovorax sp. J22R115 TaxID=3053509 RepID=UPI0025791D16|nr:type I restriction-modification system subunit M [Variovorax sp. J22R115]MDM0051400.1 type I restriction-modification system subunit M [Variovorax sp. J22R115]